MQKEVEEHITRLSNVDLCEYVMAGAEAYTPDAIAFAQDEVRRRGLSEGGLVVLNEEVVDRAATR